MTPRHVIQLARKEHWVKNLFVFMPAFFAARLSEPCLFARAALVFAAFSLTASAVYVLNDLADVAQDRNHPDKKKRPIATGVVSRSEAVALFFGLFVLGLALAFFLGHEAMLICAIYFFVNVLYSFYLKHIAILDVSLIGLGFLLRVFAGGAATGVEVSQWLIVLTFLLALILGLAKRRGEYMVAAQGQTFRRALEGYNLPFLDLSIAVCSTVAIVAYLMYCFSPEVTERIGSDHIFYSSLFVIMGVLRYLQLTLVFNKTESPTRALLHDRFLQVTLLAWIGCFVWLLYVKHWIT